MNHFIKNSILIQFCFLLGVLGMLSGCSDDDDAGGPIRVDSVFLQDVDSDVPDREVSFARLGQLLRLQGSGLDNIKQVYVNGFQTSFNPVYLSETSMLLRISGDTPIIEAEESVRNTIRLENDSQETVISLEIRDAAPSINRISHTMPKAGEEITVYGTGLIEVTSVSFPGDIVVDQGITYDEEEGLFFTVTVPEGVSPDGGSLLIESANGRAYSPAYFNFENGLILDFDGAGALGEFGNTIRQDQLATALVGEGNTSQGAYVPHRPPGIEAFDAGSNRVSEVFTSGETSWRTQFGPYIPLDTPANEVAFQFDIYVPEAWENTGYLKILLINNFNGGEWSGAAYNYIPWIVDGEVEAFETEGWTTVTVPFSDFYSFTGDDITFEDVIATREAATYKNFGIFFENSDINLSDVIGSSSDEVLTSSETSIQVYTDNWRVVPLETPTVTDFPE